MQGTIADGARFQTSPVSHTEELRLSRTTIALHWFVGVGVTGLGILGKVMEVNEFFSLYPLHKSLGILAFITILARVIWRLCQGWPTPASQYQAWEHIFSKAVHILLLIGMVLMPLSGMLASGISGHGFGIFSWYIVPSNYGADGAAISYSPFWENIGYGLHRYVAYTMAALIGLHIFGALKHHVIDKDNTLKRMPGRAA